MEPINIDDLLRKFPTVRVLSKDHWQVHCPAHPDRNPSLDIKISETGKILLHCFAGCAYEAIIATLDQQGTAPPKSAGDPNHENRKVVATYNYQDAKGKTLYRIIRLEPKAFRVETPDESGKWRVGLHGVETVPYNLQEAANPQNQTIIICEGEQDCNEAARLGFVATCNPFGAGKWRPEYSQHLKGKKVYIVPDNDEVGRKHADQVARSVCLFADEIFILTLNSDVKDLTEWVALGDPESAAESLRELMRTALKYPAAKIQGAEPMRSPKTIKGEGVPIGTSTFTYPKPEFNEVALAAQEIEIAFIVNEIADYLRSHVIITQAQALVIAVWTVHTYTYQESRVTPYLQITSPERESGKSLLLELLEVFVMAPWLTDKVTAAVLVRTIDETHPTVLLDEVDTTFSKSDPEYAAVIRNVLNSGWRRGGRVSMCVGKHHELKNFSTFCPKALAGIKHLPDTVASRSIPIAMKRKKIDQTVFPFQAELEMPKMSQMRTNLAYWASQNIVNIAEVAPRRLEGLSDRQNDACEPLLGIAAVGGVELSGRLECALVEILSRGRVYSESIGELLLKDIRNIFLESQESRLASQEIVTELAGMEMSPWATFSRGKRLEVSGLARLLKPFGIFPRQKFGNARGYQIDDFNDAFERYLKPVSDQDTVNQEEK